MAIILGIDPGSRITGYGLIRLEEKKPYYVASGCIRLSPKKALSIRVGELFGSVTELIQQYQPQEVALEDIFMNQYAGSALRLGEARGAIMAAVTQQNLPLYEYAARLVKQTVVGTGQAEKVQVQHMMKALLKLSGLPAIDAADALAVALCHIYQRSLLLSTV